MYIEIAKSICVVSDSDIIMVVERGLIKIFINPLSSNDYIEIKLYYDEKYVLETIISTFNTYFAANVIVIKDEIIYNIIDAISEVFNSSSIVVKYFTTNWLTIGYIVIELSQYADIVSLYANLDKKEDIKTLDAILDIIAEDNNNNIVIYISGDYSQVLQKRKLDKKISVIIKSQNHNNGNFLDSHGIVYEDIVSGP